MARTWPQAIATRARPWALTHGLPWAWQEGTNRLKLDATRVYRLLKGALLGGLGVKSLSLLTLLEVNL